MAVHGPSRSDRSVGRSGVLLSGWHMACQSIRNCQMLYPSSRFPFPAAILLVR